VYIKYGWDKLSTDPDNGKNCCKKLAASCILNSTSVALFQFVPSPQDKAWANRLYNILKITFGTIYDYLVDRRLVLKKSYSLGECC